MGMLEASIHSQVKALSLWLSSWPQQNSSLLYTVPTAKVNRVLEPKYLNQ